MTLREWVNENLDEALLADGFDEAVLGWCYTPGVGARLVYDAKKCVEILMATSSMSRDEACEFFFYNTEGTYVGPLTPVFLRRFRPEEIKGEKESI